MRFAKNDSRSTKIKFYDWEAREIQRTDKLPSIAITYSVENSIKAASVVDGLFEPHNLTIVMRVLLCGRLFYRLVSFICCGRRKDENEC
jgi:hypothetical protein